MRACVRACVFTCVCVTAFVYSAIIIKPNNITITIGRPCACAPARARRTTATLVVAGSAARGAAVARRSRGGADEAADQRSSGRGERDIWMTLQDKTCIYNQLKMMLNARP